MTLLAAAMSSAPLAIAAAAAVSLAPNGNTLTVAGPVAGESAALTLDTAGPCSSPTA
jgi:hypothetical protein